MEINSFKASQRFIGLSQKAYRLLKPASAWHKHAWIAESEFDGQFVLFKSPLRTVPEDQIRAIRQLSNEIGLLSSPLNGIQGVRQMLDSVSLQGERAGIFEYLEYDLHKFHLTDKRSLTLDEIKTCARQLLTALRDIHNQKIIHTDLKMENIAFHLPKSKAFWRATPNPSFQILDFGVAASAPEDRHRTITNPYWRSPESWLGLEWGPPTDVWSLGVIIGSLLMEPGTKLLQTVGNPGKLPPEKRDLESIRALWTLTGLPPVLVSRASPELRNEISQFKPVVGVNGQAITLGLIGESFDADKGGWDFITTAMEPDPDRRPTAEQLLLHPWIK